MQEDWRPIPGFDGYEVSDQGRVASLKSSDRRIMRASADRYGYLRVTLRTPTGAKSRRIHGCVTEAFLGPRPDRLEVRHLDGDQTNNSLSNLAYGTRSENVLDAVRHGTFIAGRPVKTHCPHGHEYTPENSYFSPTGKKFCRTCKRASRLRQAA